MGPQENGSISQNQPKTENLFPFCIKKESKKARDRYNLENTEDLPNFGGPVVKFVLPEKVGHVPS